MPKILILLHAHSDDIAPLAQAVAEGARSVRFAEVDVRTVSTAEDEARAGTSAPIGKRLGDPEALADYDAIIFGASRQDGSDGDALSALCAGVQANLSNKVGSAFVPASVGDGRPAALWRLFTPMSDRRMILVPPRVSGPDEDELEAARHLGKRVTDIVGWITHARSHHHH